MDSGLGWRPATAARCSHAVARAAARCFLPEFTADAHPLRSEAFGPDRRLPDKAAFDNVFSAPDIRLRRHPFSLLARRRDTGDARLGMVVGKRHARQAVDRNRIRRILRDHFRRLDLPAYDVIVLARPGAGDADTAQLHASAAWMFDHLGSAHMQKDEARSR